MRKIDITDYDFDGVTFQMRQSIASVLFNEDRLDGREVIARDLLARKIEETKDDFVLLEESDYKKVVGGLKATDLKPHGRSVVEFLKRILDAPEVDVKEK